MFNKIQLAVFTLLVFCFLYGYFPDPLQNSGLKEIA